MKFKIEQSRDATVFMPSNEAFRHLDIRKVNRMSLICDSSICPQLTYPQMIQILNYHNLPEVYKFGEMKPGEYQFETVEGSHINVTIGDEGSTHRFLLNNDVEIVGSMHETPMGVAYITNRFLIPAQMQDEVKDSLKAAKIEDKVQETLDNLEVPGHVEATNRDHDRYDRLPDLPNEKADDEQGVISQTRRTQATKIQQKTVGVLPASFKASRARTEGFINVFPVMRKTRTAPSPSGGPLKRDTKGDFRIVSRPRASPGKLF